MDFPGLIVEHGRTNASALVGLVAAAGPLGWLCARSSRRIRVRVRRPRPQRTIAPIVARAASLLGIAVAIGSSPAAAGTRKPVSPNRRVADAAPPWSEAGGFPPPRPLARTGAGSKGGPGMHPAIHRADEGHASPMAAPAPLFPRHGGAEQASDGGRDERRAAMARHPSGKAPRIHREYVVKPDDSLWSIAERLLGSDDVRAVARYWPRIHRANRTTIGPDPSLIRPGQVLELPPFERSENN